MVSYFLFFLGSTLVHCWGEANTSENCKLKMLLPPNTFRRHWMTYVEVLEGKRKTSTRPMLIVFSILSLFHLLVCGFYLMGVINPTYRVTSEWWAVLLLAGFFPKHLQTPFMMTLFPYSFFTFLGVSFELFQFKKQVPPFMSIFTITGQRKLSLANRQKFETMLGRFFRIINWNLMLLQMTCLLFTIFSSFFLGNAWWIDKKLCLFWIFMGMSVNLSCVYGEFHQICCCH